MSGILIICPWFWLTEFKKFFPSENILPNGTKIYRKNLWALLYTIFTFLSRSDCYTRSLILICFLFLSLYLWNRKFSLMEANLKATIYGRSFYKINSRTSNQGNYLFWINWMKFLESIYGRSYVFFVILRFNQTIYLWLLLYGSQWVPQGNIYKFLTRFND